MHTVHYKLFDDKTGFTADFIKKNFHDGWDKSPESDVGVARAIFFCGKFCILTFEHAPGKIAFLSVKVIISERSSRSVSLFGLSFT